MKIYFAANEISGFHTFSNATDIIDTRLYDTNYVGSCIALNSIGWVKSPVIQEDITSCWLRLDKYFTSANPYGANQVPISFINENDVEAVQLFCPETDKIQARYWDGSGWVNLGTPVTISRDNHTLHVQLRLDGWIALFVGETKILEEWFTFTPYISKIKRFRLRATSGLVGAHYSQIIMAERNTFKLRYKTLVPSANGAVNDWTGDYTKVADLNTAFSTGGFHADTIQTNSAGAKTMFKVPARSFPEGAAIEAAVVSFYGQQRVTPAGVKALIGTGGTPSANPLVRYLEGVNAGGQILMDLNPMTGAKWTTAEAAAAALEFGLEAV